MSKGKIEVDKQMISEITQDLAVTLAPQADVEVVVTAGKVDARHFVDVRLYDLTVVDGNIVEAEGVSDVD